MNDRFAADVSEASPGSIVRLDATQSHHLLRVLRAGRGSYLTVFGNGREFDAVLVGKDGALAMVELRAENPLRGSPSLKIVYALPWLKGGRTEFVVQKLTELGVVDAIIFSSCREVARGSEAKLERLKMVAQESCKQCGRTTSPNVLTMPSLAKALESTGLRTEQCFVLYEGETSTRFTSGLRAAGVVSIHAQQNPRESTPAIFIASGPEGGFTETEIMSVRGKAEIVSLGSRVLRAETAPLAAVSAALALCGEF